MDMVIGWIVEQIGYAGLYGGVGLLVGWNVLPQPAFVKGLWDKAKAKISG